jgi:hypothetical protein
VVKVQWAARNIAGHYEIGEFFMIYPPGQGKTGQFLMGLWRDYLEQYADKEGDVEAQTIVAAYQSVEVLAALSKALDRNGRYKSLNEQRLFIFHEGVKQAADFPDCLINATFSMYNNLNTLSHQFTDGSGEAAALITKVDDQVRQSTESAEQVQRAAAALRACFALLGLITIALDKDRLMTNAIRQIEQRFSAGAGAATSDLEHLVNALYRLVEMIQLLALLTDADLRDQINQIATRFKEEDQSREAALKLRNGFCRLFELGHLLVTHIDEMI